MKPPILFLHGACSGPAHMEPWRAFFTAAGYSCAVPALPGHGPDDTAALSRLGMNDYSAAVLAAHRACTRPPVVIGHSTGGLLAQQLAATADCAAVVLVGSLPPGRLPVTASAIRHFLPLVPKVVRGRTFRPKAAALEALVLHDLAVAERQEVLPDFGPESGRVFRALALGLVRVDARAVRCPVFVLHGGADRLVPVSVGRRLAKRYGADLAIVPGHGHWLVAGSLLELAAVPVLTWIAGLDARAKQAAVNPSFPPGADV
jgi:pimeloyl-ACP methyl ester carboxylesterase